MDRLISRPDFRDLRPMVFLSVAIGLCGLARAGDAETNLMTNGSFELWSHYGKERVGDLLNSGGVYDDPRDPLLPVRWSWRLSGKTLLRRSVDAHGGKYSLELRGDGASLSWSSLEVTPGATYSFGVWAKGTSEIVVRLSGQAPEGGQNLGEAAGRAGDTWQLIEKKVKIPGHLRVLDLNIEARNGQVLLDDAHISAPLDFAYDADAVLTRKAQADADTILFVDFDKDDPAVKLTGKCRYVSGGRFGRALRVEAPDSALLPLKLDQAPREGTIECWLSPDRLEQLDWQAKKLPGPPIYHFLTVDDATGPLAQFQADTSCTLRWAWDADSRIGYTGPRRGNSVAGPSEVSLQRMRSGQWTHVAVAWDAASVRMYVDGVLYARTTQGPLRWRGAPTGMSVSSNMYGHLCWSGCIDEIRVSKVKRFGPFVPKGALPRPLPPAQEPPEEAASSPAKPALTAPQLAAERAKLIRRIAPTRPGAFEDTPDADGDFVYEALRGKPLVGDGKFEIQADKPVKGLTTVRVGESLAGRLIGDPVNSGACWTLGAIPAGKYCIGLLYESQRDWNGITECPQGQKAVNLFLNGRIIQPGSTSDPVQAAPGAWLTEIRSLSAETLKPGDEIELVTGGACDVNVARLLLHARPPVAGAGRAPLHYGEDWWNNVDTSLRANALCYFADAKGQRLPGRNMWWGPEQVADSPADFLRGPDDKAVACCLLSNPLPVPATVDFDCVVKGYYGQVAGRLARRFTLGPHQRVMKTIPFDVTEDDPAYSIKATVSGAAGEAAALRERLGWPEMDTISFFPGYRQSVPWHDPLTSSHAKRITFKQPLKTERRALSLNGTWERAFFYELVPAAVPPADSKWENAPVPIAITQELAQTPRRQFGAYYRRTFELAEDGAPRTYRLVISQAAAEATAYVNGVKVGVLRGSNTPLAADVSAAIKPGKNEILIVVRDLLAVMDPAYVNPASPTPSPLYLDAPSSWEACNSILLGDVGIEASPAVAADDLLITTSFRKKSIAADFSVVNHTSSKIKAVVRATVLDARRPVLDLGRQEVELEVNRSLPLKFSKPWDGARLWSPADPQLYVLAVEIADARTGKRIDLARQRFGFRETWIEGADILFNGIRIKPKGLTTPSPICIDLDFTMGRGAWFPDYFDENGFLASENLAGVGNSSSKHNVDRDAFWEAACANVLAGAKRAQNHPSIIAWDLSNEWYGFLSYSGADPLLGAKRLENMTTVLQRQDPNRWTFYNGDEDLSGLHYAFSGHYLTHYRSDYGMDGHSAYAPDRFFFRPLDRQFEIGQQVLVSPYRRVSVAWGKKLLMNTENLWKTGWMMPPGPSEFIGEEDALSPAVDGGSGANAWYVKQNLDGHRDLNCAIVAYYGGVCPSRRGWMLQQFIMPEMVHHAYAGVTLTRDYTLHSDLYLPSKVAVVWRLLAADGVVVAKGEDRREMTSGDLQRGTLTFSLPEVDKRRAFTLNLKMYSDGKPVYAEQRDIDVWPRPQGIAAGQASRLYVFDPSGKTIEAMRGQGIPAAGMGSLAQLPADARAVVIGEDALTDATAGQPAGLEKFVEGGGRVVVLAQTVTPGGLPVATRLEPKEWASQVFVQAPEHPIFDSAISSWDLHFWAPARVVGRGAYAKPDAGPFTVLANSGSTIGMEWVQLMECYRGKGSYILCQLPLISAAGQEPMARVTLGSVVRYALAGKPYFSPRKTLKTLTSPGSLVDRRLRDVGAAVEAVVDAGPLAEGDVALIDATHKDAPAAAARWKKSLAAGATLVVAGAAAADAKWLSELAGKEVKVTVQPYRMWEGRGYRNGCSPLTAGLTQLDLYFKSYDGSESASSQAEDPRLVVEPLAEYSVAVDGARQWVFPGLLLELPVGKGKLILDQRRWMTAHEQLAKSASRQVSALAIGLGVSVAPAVPTRELPREVTYGPIDLSVWANRSTTDKTPDDGKDGWPDQGARCDAHEFPTGRHDFQGVPFEIAKGDRNVVVLRNPGRPGPAGFPTEVSIPIGLRVEGFYFIHGSAFTPRATLGLYQIQYADGTTLDVPLKEGVNLWDWADASQDFAREKGTRSNVAWTGSNEIFPTITIYRMLWVNPRPQTAVKAVRFASAGQSTLMLAGLTAVLAKGQEDVTPRRVAEARQALIDAARATDAGKFDEARKRLLAAVKADPSLTAARQALADLYERKGDEDAAFQTYTDWVAAGAATPLPYNRIGEILEKRKDYKGALEAYAKSLALEWNQPPIIEAKSRVQKIVLENR